jgi:hypothetical protein
MRRTMLLKITSLARSLGGGEDEADRKREEEMKEKKGKEEVKLPPLHLKIPLLEQ